MASIHKRKRATPMGKPWEVRWRGPDYNAKGHLNEHMRSFYTLPEAKGFVENKLSPLQQVPAHCDCDPARWVLVDANMLALGPVTCSICGQEFTPFTPAGSN
jgi:hypothetical protein